MRNIICIRVYITYFFLVLQIKRYVLLFINITVLNVYTCEYICIIYNIISMIIFVVYIYSCFFFNYSNNIIIVQLHLYDSYNTVRPTTASVQHYGRKQDRMQHTQTLFLDFWIIYYYWTTTD